jgi:dephospho-CoA kinase
MSTPLLIGLTGGIGTGKSSAAAELAAMGAEVVSGDDLGKQVLENSPELLTEIGARYGSDIFYPNGTVRRRALGEKVFGSPSEVKWLIEATFPGIHRLWRQAVERSSQDVVVLDAALIYEWKIESEFDWLVVVVADRETITRRMNAGGRLTAVEVMARLAAQIDPDSKARRADVVLTNNGTPEELIRQVREFWQTRITPEIHRRRVPGNDRSSPAH